MHQLKYKAPNFGGFVSNLKTGATAPVFLGKKVDYFLLRRLRILIATITAPPRANKDKMPGSGMLPTVTAMAGEETKSAMSGKMLAARFAIREVFMNAPYVYVVLWEARKISVA